ncbi:MAG: hypothetical protein WC313_02130 [Candidatus Kapaibacterium sp.]|jgi:cbb3-type cytochrome oxidase subunit 3|nr:hypothetical protein [Candidatus Kapabacteria bacterium]
MFKNIFSHISGIEIYPILTLIFFFTFFLAVLVMALRLDKKFVNYMGNLPLENDENEFTINTRDSYVKS